MEKEIYPIFDTEDTPIVFESSGFFIPYLSVALQTILDTADANQNYDIIILGDKIHPSDMDRILTQVANFRNISVRFFEPFEQVRPYVETAVYSYITVNYYRMALPWILRNYKKAVNLGADILVLKDIHQLCELTFEDGKYLAGARDLGYIGRLKEDIPQTELDLAIPEEYINADVLIYNLEGIRADYTLDGVMATWQKHHYRCAEQDALNKLFDGHKQLIDLRWNTYPDRMTSTTDIMCTSPEFIAEWENCLQDPFLVHFAAVPKPWDYPIIGFGDQWWDVAKKSVYYEEIIRRMANPKVHKQSSLAEILDAIFPKGTKRREIVKKFKPKEKWGLNS